MKLPRRSVLGLIGFFMLLSVVLRYPETTHELGVDSFFIHNLSTLIARDGHATWILSPFSLFGWYPMSYPSGGPFLIAGFTEISDIPTEGSILILSLMFGSLGVPMAFVMAREIRKDDLFSLAVAFSFAFAPRYLDFTLWSASTRGLFMVLLPLFIWAILRTYREPSLLNYALLALLAFLLSVTHRLAILMALVLMAFIAALILQAAMQVIRLRYPQVALTDRYRRVIPLVGLAAFSGVVSATIFGTGILSQYSTGELFSGQSVGVELLNFIVSLSRSVGLALVLALVGIASLARTRNKTLKEPFLVLSFIALAPTLFLRVYTGFYLLPFIAIFAGFAVSRLARIKRPWNRRAFIAMFFAGSLIFSTGVLQYEISQSTSMPMTTYATALYLGPCAPDQTIISNDGLVAIRVAAISGCAYLPVGGAGTTSQSPEVLSYHYFSPQEVLGNMAPVPIQNVGLDSDSPWFVSSINAEADWVSMMESPYNATGTLQSRYHPTLYLENRYLAGEFFAFGNRYPAPLALSAYAGAYKLYDSGAEALWYIASPH